MKKTKATKKVTIPGGTRTGKTAKRKKPILRASESSAWVNCPGSTHIKTGKYPFDNEDNGTFGNAVHSAAASILKGEEVKLTVQEELWKNERPDDFEFYLNFYLEAVKNFRLSNGLDEDPLESTDVITIIEDYFEVNLKTHKITGHCDFAEYTIFYYPKGKVKIVLQIIDLKTGFIPVSVYDNLQLFVYAHLILYDILKRHKLWAAYKKDLLEVEIESIIAQPAHNVIKFSDIAFSPDRFETLYHPDDKTLKTGSWCKYCDKADICPEMKKVFKEYYQPRYQGVTIDRIDLIKEVLPMASVVEKVAKRFQADAKAILKDGGKIPGYKMGKRGGARAWQSSLTKKDIAKGLKVKEKEITAESLMSPAQVEKKYKDRDLSALIWQPMNDVLMEDSDNGLENRETK